MKKRIFYIFTSDKNFSYIICSLSFDLLVVDIKCKVLPSTKNNKYLSSIASICWSDLIQWVFGLIISYFSRGMESVWVKEEKAPLAAAAEDVPVKLEDFPVKLEDFPVKLEDIAVKLEVEDPSKEQVLESAAKALLNR
jgi:hypothetical protein